MPKVHVTSEIGPLRSVLVHTPGKELVAVTPGTREDYLYDDIIDLEIAEREHRRLVAVLERFAQVHEVRDTLVEIAGRPEVREFLTTRALEVVPSDALAKQLAALSSEDFVQLMVEGALEDGGPIARALNEVAYALPPLPNRPYFATFMLDTSLKVADAARLAGMTLGEFLALNPGFTNHVIPRRNRINLPVDQLAFFEARFDEYQHRTVR